MKIQSFVTLGMALFFPGVLSDCSCTLSGNYTGNVAVINYEDPSKSMNGTFAAAFDLGMVKVTFQRGDKIKSQLDHYSSAMKYLREFDGSCTKCHFESYRAEARFDSCVPTSLKEDVTNTDDGTTYERILSKPNLHTTYQVDYTIKSDCEPIKLRFYSHYKRISVYFTEGNIRYEKILSDFQQEPDLTLEDLTKHHSCVPVIFG